MRYSIQFGPPSAVPVYISRVRITLSVQVRLGKALSTYLILNYLIRKQSFRVIGKVELISNETIVLAALSSLDIGVGITECNPSISG